MGRLIILTGPSCAGKSPLKKALYRLHPHTAASLQEVVLYTSRSARPGEREGHDYYFRDRGEMKKMQMDDTFIVMNVRADIQALDLADLMGQLESGDVLYEGNPYIAQRFLQLPSLQNRECISIFLSPLNKEEMAFITNVEHIVTSEFVTEIMRRKLLRRLKSQKGVVSLPDLRDIEHRAHAAFDELKCACLFDYVIPNHDGEDSENWDAFYYPIGDARRALHAFVNILEGRTDHTVEHWENGIIR